MHVCSKVSTLRSGGGVALMVVVCAALSACDPKLPVPGPPQPKAEEAVASGVAAPLRPLYAPA